MKIGFSMNEGGGCAYYRCEVPAGELVARGHETVPVVSYENASECDVVVMQRASDDGISEMLHRLAANGTKLVYDLDDDLFSIDPSNERPYRIFTPEVLAQVWSNIEVSTAVTVTTEALAEVIRPHNPNVFVLPNMLESQVLGVQRPRRDRVTLGWSGSSCHDADWRSAARPIAAYLSRSPEVDLHLIGADYRVLLGQPDARQSGWTPMGKYYQSIDFDLAMIPLAWQVFNRSKSDVKLLEYSALGIPSVASDYGPYSAIVHGKTGFLVNHDHEWRKYLRELANDADLREEMGTHARDWAASRTIQGNAHLWEQAYEFALAA